MKKILVACGAGAVTSTSAIMKIKEALKAEGLNAQIDQAKMMEVESRASNYDLVVTTGNYDSSKIKTRYIKGMPLLTGIGIEKTLAEIVSVIKEEN